ncbi:MAG: chemotaxis response regulator protein-glutamate methylesterase [Synergistaceae bacterium]|jgi:two-component system chemotaxis response regulator CheB|nr:chemotaxis response regulator protein-glutamate methylesterase [Synergistaceae bacterium]
MGESGSKVKVLIVDDSALMRKLLGDILSSDSRIEVVGTARDGVDALAKARTLSPDVITLDVEMPKKNGLEVLEELLPTHPIPVIMVSTQTREGAHVTLKALALGSVDFICKPLTSFSHAFKEMGPELISKVIMAKGASVRVRSAPYGRARGDAQTTAFSFQDETSKNAVFSGASKGGKRDIVAIAASTGGPMALLHLFSRLPQDFPVPIVITQHMPKDFTNSFARRLDAVSLLSVVEGEEGTELKPGCAVLAPGGSHLIIKRRPNGASCCGLSDAPPMLSVKPSANIMFQSVAEEFGGRVVGVVLTGMGRDGAEGAVALHAKGAYIIAEAQETCVVYGMPKAAVEAGIVDEVVPLTGIPEVLVRCLKG